MPPRRGAAPRPEAEPSEPRPGADARTRGSTPSGGWDRPRVSVIVRSFNRLPALCELLDKLRAQDHDSFEIVIVDQSTTREPAADAQLAAAVKADPRVRLYRYPPLGGPRAQRGRARLAR